MPLIEGPSHPDGDTDKVPLQGPRDPVLAEQFDESVSASLRNIRDEALILRDAHSAELDLQGKFHAGEVERHDRVVRACNSALHELEISQQEDQAYGPQMSQASATEQIQQMKQGRIGR